MPAIDSYPIITNIQGDEKLLCSSTHTSDDANNITPNDLGNFLISIGGFVESASNIGASGQGVFKMEASGDLQFRKIDQNSAKITVSTSGDIIKIDANEANFNLANIGGLLSLPAQVSGVLSQPNGGTGESTYSSGQLLIGNSSGGLTKSTLTAGYMVTVQNQSGAIKINSIPKGYINGLTVSFNSVSSVVIGSGSCADSTGTFGIESNSNITVSITTSGVNGLDTGAEAPSTWYAVYIISDSNLINPPAGLLSTNSTTPTMPSGYDKFRRVGFIRNNASSNILNFIQSGTQESRIYYWNDALANFVILTNGSATAFTAVSASSSMCPGASLGKFLLAFTNPGGGAATDQFYTRPTGSTVTIANTINRFSRDAGSANPARVQIDFVANSAQQIDYAVTSASNTATLTIISYQDFL